MTQLSLSRVELRLIYEKLTLHPTGVNVETLDKLRRMLAERAGADFGDRVFELVLPLSVKRGPSPRTGKDRKPMVLAPTLNQYDSMQPFEQKRMREQVDLRIMAELKAWPRALLRGESRRRGVRVVRRSASPCDEMSVDVLGGKIPIDRLVKAGVLRGDSMNDLVREALWQPAPPGEGTLTVTIFELV